MAKNSPNRMPLSPVTTLDGGGGWPESAENTARNGVQSDISEEKSALHAPESTTNSILASSPTAGATDTALFAVQAPTTGQSNDPKTTESTTATSTNGHEETRNVTDTTCRWLKCAWPQQPSQAALVGHLTERHLRVFLEEGELAKSVACHWEGCADYGAPKFTRTALVNHLRIHTGEKRFFCPIPECAKFFGKQDILARHLKVTHELHATKDGLVLHSDRAKRLKLRAPTDDFLGGSVEHDDEFRTPWWYSLNFIDLFHDKNTPVLREELLEAPLQTKQYRAAVEKYRPRMGQDPSASHLELTANIPELQQTCEMLESRLKVATRVSSILHKNLEHYKREKRELWIATQILLDANAALSIPDSSSSAQPDDTDKYILES